MSCLPFLTQSAPGVPIFAPASGGGGGSVPPDLNLSTLLVAQKIELDNYQTSPQSLFRMTGIDTSTIRIGLVGSSQTTLDFKGGTGCSLQLNNADFIVSSINGAAPGGGGGASPNGQFSTLAVSSCMLVNPGSFNYAPANDGTVGAPVFGVTIESSDGNSLYTREIANGSGLLDNFKGVSSSTATAGLRTLVNSANAYVGYPSSYLANDGGQTIYAYSTLRQIAPSTISLEAPLVSVSSLSVSSINGSAYPPVQTIPAVSTTTLGFNQQFNSLSYAGGVLQSVSSIFSSPTISTTRQMTISGGLTGYITFAGTGNTNPLNNSTSSGFSAYRMNLLVDEGLPTQQTYPIAFAAFSSAGNNPPPGTTNYRPASWSSIDATASYMVNAAPDYNTPTTYGQEVMFQQFGAHTYKMLYEIDCFLNSGDPTSGYNMVVQIPSANMPPLNANYQ